MGHRPEHSCQRWSDDVSAQSSFRVEYASSRQRDDAAAIQYLVRRYTDAVNHREWDTVRDCWDEDGVWDLGPPVNVRKTGRDDIMAEVRSTVEAMKFFFQMPHASTILSLDNDQATGRTSLHEIAKMKPGSGVMDGAEGMSIHASYLDKFVRSSDGQWRF
ncbi:MAG: nuclear transport factor 2 family protein, partial [Pseudomonadota bacterium]